MTQVVRAGFKDKVIIRVKWLDGCVRGQLVENDEKEVTEFDIPPRLVDRLLNHARRRDLVHEINIHWLDGWPHGRLLEENAKEVIEVDISSILSNRLLRVARRKQRADRHPADLPVARSHKS